MKDDTFFMSLAIEEAKNAKQYENMAIGAVVVLNGDYARMVDLRRIIKYYENNKERNMEDFLNEFQEYSGY